MLKNPCSRNCSSRVFCASILSSRWSSFPDEDPELDLEPDLELELLPDRRALPGFGLEMLFKTLLASCFPIETC